MSIENLLTEKERYVKEQADKIVRDMTSRNRVEWTVSTCDYSNWDKKLHRMFPAIAEELRSRGLNVSSSVNWGVTDWIITV